MASFDKRVDTYIAKSAPFAQPILEHIRELVHRACPDIEETMKWSFPHFSHQGIVCSMAAFKQHCTFGFWKGSIMQDPKGILFVVGKTAMGNFERIASVDDLPSDKIMLDYIRQAVRLNENDVKLPPKKTSKSAVTKVPEDFTKALKKNRKASTVFERLSNSQKKEYVVWITGAKSDETRNRRMEQSVEWLSEGKNRNWKYEKKK